MRSLNSNATLAVGIAAIAAWGVWGETGCSPTKPTEIVPGALTQVQVPKDLGAIKLTVLANGAQKFCRGYVVGPNGSVELPSTLGVISGAPGTTLTISLRGYNDASSPDVNNCEGSLAVNSTDPINGPGPRVLRQAVVSYVDQHTLFLPMPLSFSCYDKDCSAAGSDSTCIAAQCASGGVEADSLAEFTPALIDGTGECFNPTQCFAASVPATVVDAASCLYTVPEAMPTMAGGLNVRITYTDIAWAADPGTGLLGPQPGVPLEREILSVDAREGFILPDAAQPTQFQLAPGLCSLVQNATTPPQPTPSTYHSISNVEVAVGCPSKLPLLPFCAGQQTGNVSTSATPSAVTCGVPVPLEPTPSALYLVMDDSGSMYAAFGPTGYATAMNLSLADPVFKHTYVAFRFLSHLNSECTSGSTVYTTPGANGGGGVDFGLAPNVQPQVATSLLNWQAPDTFSNPAPLDLQAAMRLDEGAYQHLLDFARRLSPDAGAVSPLDVGAVMFFVNRTPVVPASAGDGGAVDAGDGSALGDAGAGGNEFPTTAADCPLLGQPSVVAALTQEAQAAFAQNLQTYFIVLNDQQNTPQPQLDFYNQVASPPATPESDAGTDAETAEGGGAPAPTGVTVLNATSTLTSVFASFQTTLTSVATCLYDLPTGVDTTAALSFLVPPGNAINTSGTPVPFQVVRSSSCSASTSTSANGWNIDNGRIRLCGGACQQLQATVGAAAAAALGPGGDAGTGGGLPTSADGGAVTIPDVPVTVVMPCGDGGSP
jgi:hypothetical protein